MLLGLAERKRSSNITRVLRVAEPMLIRPVVSLVPARLSHPAAAMGDLHLGRGANVRTM